MFLLRNVGLALALFCSHQAHSAQPVILEAEDAFRLSIALGSDGNVEMGWEIAFDHYLYRDKFEVRDVRDGRSLPLRTGPGVIEEADVSFGASEVYYMEAFVRLHADPPPSVHVTWQGCRRDTICYAPQSAILDTTTLAVIDPERSALDIPSGEAVGLSANPGGSFDLADDSPDAGLIGSTLARGGVPLVLASFLAFGVLLAFTPCVLPMYPILSATLARQGERPGARRGFVLSIAYVVAMATAFGMLGIVAVHSGRNLQIALQSPAAIAATAGVFVVLACSMFGLFELRLPSAWVDRVSRAGSGRRGSVGGAALMGFGSALVVGPCVTAPLAAALIYIASTGDAALGAASLFALGLGQGIPLVAFGTIGSAALPRAGRWMVGVKHLFGFMMLAAAIWVSSRLLPPSVTLGAWSALAAALALALLLPGTGRRLPKPRRTAGMLAVSGSLVLAVGVVVGADDPLRPLAPLFTAGAVGGSAAETYSSASSIGEVRTLLAAADGRPTFLWFTADWCVICKSVERDVLADRAVSDVLGAFSSIEVDLTRMGTDLDVLIREFGVVGPPTMVFLDASGAEHAGTRLVGGATISDFLRSARSVDGGSRP